MSNAPKHAMSKAAPSKRARATHKLLIRLAVCLVVAVGVYVAQATGDLSGRLALILTGVVVAVGAFCAGIWAQYMWTVEG